MVPALAAVWSLLPIRGSSDPTSRIELTFAGFVYSHPWSPRTLLVRICYRARKQKSFPMLTDAPPRKGSRVEFLESDRAKILDLPQNGSLPDIVRGLESAMKASVAPDVRKTCAGFWRLVVPGKTNVLGVGMPAQSAPEFRPFLLCKTGREP